MRGVCACFDININTWVSPRGKLRMRGTLGFIVSSTAMVRISKRHTGEIKERGEASEKGKGVKSLKPVGRPVENEL